MSEVCLGETVGWPGSVGQEGTMVGGNCVDHGVPVVFGCHG